MNFKIWLSAPHIGNSELKYIHRAFEENWIAPLGPNVDGFEKDLERFLDLNSQVAVLSSGTAALHLSLILTGVKSGDEVICQSMTFSASANPIVYLGATPIFVDSEKETWNISPELLEEAIQDRIKKGKKPKAVIAVDLYGIPFQYDEIKEICNRYEITLIEDAAEALGSEYKQQKCGTLGDFSILSFNGNKIITTSGGGALRIADNKLKTKAIFLATQARDDAPHYQHSEIGYNYRMSNIIAGIGRGQMEVLEDRIQSRRSNFEYYKENLSGFEGIEFLPEPKGCFSNRWLSCILTKSYEEREKIRLKLLSSGIESRPLWKPMHIQPVFDKSPHYLNGVSEDLFNRGLCLPSGSNLSRKNLDSIIGKIKS